MLHKFKFNISGINIINQDNNKHKPLIDTYSRNFIEMTSIRGIGTVAILVLLSTSTSWARELGEPLSPRALEEMLDNDDVKFLFDFRTNSSRDTDGYIETSIIVPEELTLDKARASPKSDVIPAGNE